MKFDAMIAVCQEKSKEKMRVRESARTLRNVISGGFFDVLIMTAKPSGTGSVGNKPPMGLLLRERDAIIIIKQRY